MTLFYLKDCINCGKEMTIPATDPTRYDTSFCCDKCKDTYYENKVLESAKEMGIDIPIDSRWEILDFS